MQQRAGRSRDRLADLVCSLIACSIWEDVKCNRREARGGQEAAPIGSGGARRWSRVTVGSADASETCRVASYGRRHAHIAHLLNSKKNACNGRLNGRLGVRNYDIAGLKSSSILPVRSLEAWGAQRSELLTRGGHEGMISGKRLHDRPRMPTDPPEPPRGLPGAPRWWGAEIGTPPPKLPQPSILQS